MSKKCWIESLNNVELVDYLDSLVQLNDWENEELLQIIIDDSIETVNKELEKRGLKDEQYCKEC